MMYVSLLDEIMQSPHGWENLTDQSYLDDRSEMTIQISDLVKKS